MPGASQDAHAESPLEPKQDAKQDPRTYFAAERTFLAWLRTGLALMGVGFAVARFGLFLGQMRIDSNPAPHSTGLSMYSGVLLVVLGVIVNLSAVAHHVRTVHQLRAGTWMPRVSSQAVTLALLLAGLGMGMAVFLLVVR